MSITSCIREFPGGLPCPTPASPPTSISWPRAPASPQPDSWHRFPDLLNHNFWYLSPKCETPGIFVICLCLNICISEEEPKGSTDLRARVGHPGDIILTILFEIDGIFSSFLCKISLWISFCKFSSFHCGLFFSNVANCSVGSFLYAILQIFPPVNFFCKLSF